MDHVLDARGDLLVMWNRRGRSYGAGDEVEAGQIGPMPGIVGPRAGREDGVEAVLQVGCERAAASLFVAVMRGVEALRPR
jgi:hypothetical protein